MLRYARGTKTIVQRAFRLDYAALLWDSLQDRCGQGTWAALFEVGLVAILTAVEPWSDTSGSCRLNWNVLMTSQSSRRRLFEAGRKLIASQKFK